MKKYLLCAVAAIMAFAGCDENRPDKDAGDSIEVAPSSKVFDAEGGSVTVMVTSSGDWTLEGDCAWAEPDVISGTDGDAVKFIVAPNATREQLDAEFVFVCGKAEAAFSLSVLPADLKRLELVSPANVVKAHRAADVVVELDSEISYRDLEQSVAGGDGWLEYTVTTEGDKDGSALMHFSLLENKTGETRKATITVSGAGATPVTVEVEQRLEVIIGTEKDAYFVQKESGEIEIPVTATVEYGLAVSSEGDWLVHKGKTETGEKFSYPALSEGNRVATVTLTEKSPVEGEEAVVTVFSITQKTSRTLVEKALVLTGARAYPTWEGNSEIVNSLRSFTMEAMINVENFKTDGSLSTLFGIEGTFLVRIGDSGIPCNQIQIAAKNNQVTDASLALEKDRWYHVAVTFENLGYNSIIKVYLDGVERASGSVFDSFVSFGVPHSNESGYSVSRCFWVGYAYDHARDLKGKMCEARIWNKVLVAEDFLAPDHFYSVDPESEGLVAYWKMNEGEGYEIEDHTGNGNTLYCENELYKGTENGYEANLGKPGATWADVTLPEE